MNEKIKELARQAGADVMQRSGWTDYGTLDLDVEQFAELIIQECVDTIQDHMSRGKRDDYYRGQSDSIELIKQIIDANNLQSDIGQLKKASEK